MTPGPGRPSGSGRQNVPQLRLGDRRGAAVELSEEPGELRAHECVRDLEGVHRAERGGVWSCGRAGLVQEPGAGCGGQGLTGAGGLARDRERRQRGPSTAARARAASIRARHVRRRGVVVAFISFPRLVSPAATCPTVAGRARRPGGGSTRVGGG